MTPRTAITVGIIALVVLGGAFLIHEKQAGAPGGETETIAALEEELQRVTDAGGGITPERYEELEEALAQLKEEGVDTSRAKELFGHLSVGGERTARKEPQEVAQTTETEQPLEEPQDIQQTLEQQDEPSERASAPQDYDAWLESLILPFDIGSEYDASTKSLGDLSFAGAFVISPLGGGGSDDFTYWSPGEKVSIYFEVVPETILRAPVDGTVNVILNPGASSPEDPERDYEIHFLPTGDPQDIWVEFDHVVDVLVESGEYVVAGQPIARAAPASIRHGGPLGENPVDEFEWTIKVSKESGDIALCPIRFLSEEAQQKLQRALEVMEQQGFESGESVCLVEEI